MGERVDGADGADGATKKNERARGMPDGDTEKRQEENVPRPLSPTGREVVYMKNASGERRHAADAFSPPAIRANCRGRHALLLRGLRRLPADGTVLRFDGENAPPHLQGALGPASAPPKERHGRRVDARVAPRAPAQVGDAMAVQNVVARRRGGRPAQGGVCAALLPADGCASSLRTPSGR